MVDTMTGAYGDGDRDHHENGPYYFTVNMIACDDVPVILFFHVLYDGYDNMLE